MARGSFLSGLQAPLKWNVVFRPTTVPEGCVCVVVNGRGLGMSAVGEGGVGEGDRVLIYRSPGCLAGDVTSAGIELESNRN